MDKPLRSSSIPIGPPDSTVTGSSSSPESDPDPLCATCGYLRWLYGDDDPELIAHIDTHPTIIDVDFSRLNENNPSN